MQMGMNNRCNWEVERGLTEGFITSWAWTEYKEENQSLLDVSKVEHGKRSPETGSLGNCSETGVNNAAPG